MQSVLTLRPPTTAAERALFRGQLVFGLAGFVLGLLVLAGLPTGWPAIIAILVASACTIGRAILDFRSRPQQSRPH